MTKAKYGSIKVVGRSGKLYLDFRVNGQRYRPAVGLVDTAQNRGLAQTIANQIEQDILLSQFDETLEKYKLSGKVEKLKAKSKKPQVTINALWTEYVRFKVLKGIKPKTLHDTYGPVTRYVSICPHQTLNESKEAIEWFLCNCKGKQARRVLMHLSASLKWRLKNNLVESNPFDGIYLECEKPNYEIESQARALTEDEIEMLWMNLNKSRGAYDFKHYIPFTRFMLLTGCRPSEAVGITWDCIDFKKGIIHFRKGIVVCGGELIESETTKTKKARTFPIYPELRDLLESLRNREGLVFPGREGAQAIRYDNFSARVWKKSAPAKTTPYNLRDTFITNQLIKGIPAQVVAKWVGNSVQTIERHYMDGLAFNQVMPV